MDADSDSEAQTFEDRVNLARIRKEIRAISRKSPATIKRSQKRNKHKTPKTDRQLIAQPKLPPTRLREHIQYAGRRKPHHDV